MEESVRAPIEPSAATRIPAHPSPTLRPNTFTSIQFLRMVAAGGVFFFHYFNYYWSGAGLVAREGVGLFFLISGFIMVKSTERSPSPIAFIRRRVIRVVPLYWFLTAVWIVKPYLGGSASRSGDGLPEILKSLFFVPYMNQEKLVQPILYVGWTLNYEMFFYAVFALAMALSHKFRALAASSAIAVLVLVGAIFHFKDPIQNFYFNDIMLHFLAGMVIASTIHRIPKEFAHRFAYPAVAAACIAYVLAVALSSRPPLHILPEMVVFVGAVIYELGEPTGVKELLARMKLREPAFLTNVRTSLGAANLIVLGGDLTYSIYLVHPMVTNLAAGVLMKRFHHSFGVALVMFPFVLLAILLISYLTYRFVEIPPQRLFSKKAHR